MFVGYVFLPESGNRWFVSLPFWGLRGEIREGSGWKFWRRTSSKWILKTCVFKIHFVRDVDHAGFRSIPEHQMPPQLYSGWVYGEFGGPSRQQIQEKHGVVDCRMQLSRVSICSNLWFHHSSSNGVASMGPELCWCIKLISEDVSRPFNSMLHVEKKCNTVFGAAMGRLEPIGKPWVRLPLQ